MSNCEREGTLYRFATVAALTERGGRVSTGYGTATLVGSRLNNGDRIIETLRDPRTSTLFVPIDEHGVALTPQ